MAEKITITWPEELRRIAREEIAREYDRMQLRAAAEAIERLVAERELARAEAEALRKERDALLGLVMDVLVSASYCSPGYTCRAGNGYAFTAATPGAAIRLAAGLDDAPTPNAAEDDSR
jgi:hypothetical protein